MSTFAELIKKKEKDWNCPELMNRAKLMHIKKIPFSSPLINWTTYGGIPRNRISEFLGAEGSGKTTSAVDVCKNAIEIFKQELEEELAELRKNESKNEDLIEELLERGPKKVVYIDIENAFNAEWSAKLGINPDEIDIMQPPNIPAEDLLQLVQDLIETGEVGLVVLDSIPSLVSKKELDKKYDEPTVAPIAGLMTVFTRKIVSVLTRYQCTMILINQLRDSMNNPYEIKSPGGRAIKFYASLRALFQIKCPVDFLGNELPQKTENPAGYIVAVRLLKQKTGASDRKNGEYFLMCQSGIRPVYDYAKLAINTYGIIKKGGAWFTICDPETKEPLELTDPINPEKMKPVKVNGMAKVYEYLETNTEYFGQLKKYILNDINGSDAEDNSDGESNEVL